MGQETDVLRVNVVLDEEMTKNLRQIKEAKGLKNNSEVLRFLIKDFWSKMPKDLTSES